MIRWLIIFAISFTPLIAEKSHIISFGGLSISCEHECGMIDIDPDMDEITEILNQTVKKLFVFSFPLYFGWGPLEDPFPFSPWTIDGDECSVYDWKAANSIYLPDTLRSNFSFGTYLDFQSVADQLRQDLRFYCIDVYRRELNHYLSALPALKKELQRDEFTHAHFETDGTLEYTYGDEIDRDVPIQEFYKDLQSDIRNLKKKLSNSCSENYEEKQEWLEETIQKINSKYKDIFIWCLRHHQREGIAFEDAIDHFLTGDFDYGIAQICELIEAAETNNAQDELLAKLYLLKGELQNEYCHYSDAIIDLTIAIQKNPSMKEGYFERAVSYFELGQFDLAIQDYFASGIRPTPINPTQWGLGIGAGLLEGAGQFLTDFFPSLFGSLRGVSDGLWALAKDPRGASQEAVQASQQLIGYIESHSTKEMLQDAVPELKELVQKKDQLSDFEKGRLIGQMIGKYGSEILSAKYSTKVIGAYRELKKANQLLTLEALASPEQTQNILSAAGKRWELRQETLNNGTLKIEWDKQGKHIVGHKNYERLLDQNLNPSIFTHPDPERLLKDYAGTGTKSRGLIPGTPGYQEIVNFEEFIGYSINPQTKVKTATTYGKIHYASDGVHIVPFSPEN